MNTKIVTLASALALVAAAPAIAETTSQSATTTSSSQVTFIPYQNSSHKRVSEWLGSPVKNAANETIGDVNDFVIDESGAVVGVVAGVGGFLGLGEKNVAIKLKSVTLQTGEGDKKIILVNTTKQDLSQAPEYKAPGEKTARERVNEASEAVKKTYDEAKEKVTEGVSTATEKTKEAYEAAKQSVTGSKDHSTTN